MSNQQDQQIDEIIAQVLAAGGISEDTWDNLRSNLLTSSPVWPGPDAAFDNPADLAQFIDHTLLKPDATDQQIEKLCEEAIQHRFASVCVNSCHVKACSIHLKDSGVNVCGVVGFPLGAMATGIKHAETQFAIDNGASEVDMVLNVGKFKSGDAEYVLNDIRSVVEAAWGNPVKVILETGLLEANEIIVVSVVALLAGASFLKTSTGFGHGGATEENVRIMRRVAGANLGVKASGGVRDVETAIKMIRAGANRIGTSSGVQIVKAEAGTDSY